MFEYPLHIFSEEFNQVIRFKDRESVESLIQSQRKIDGIPDSVTSEQIMQCLEPVDDLSVYRGDETGIKADPSVPVYQWNENCLYELL
ncbi:MAG: hypothetical protein F4Z01_04920 [Gammaproteobacteria bacterium]|nr:hypothetical protein [Gammaproteobacteria bacterium]MYF38114.1 hypothetical protein [Gammaproteobacteria bacterium]